MKKLLSVFLAINMLLSCVLCGAIAENNGAGEDVGAETETTASAGSVDEGEALVEAIPEVTPTPTPTPSPAPTAELLQQETPSPVNLEDSEAKKQADEMPAVDTVSDIEGQFIAPAPTANEIEDINDESQSSETVNDANANALVEEVPDEVESASNQQKTSGAEIQQNKENNTGTDKNEKAVDTVAVEENSDTADIIVDEQSKSSVTTEELDIIDKVKDDELNAIAGGVNEYEEEAPFGEETLSISDDMITVDETGEETDEMEESDQILDGPDLYLGEVDGLSATKASVTSILLTWNTMEGADEYVVMDSNLREIGKTRGTSYLLTDLVPGSRFTIYVYGRKTR